MKVRDCEKFKIGELAAFNRGFQVPRARTSPDLDIPYLHYGDIYKIYNSKINLTSEYENIIKISQNEKFKDQHLLQHNDIVFNLTSENYEDLGKTVIIKNKENLPFISGMETTKCRILKPDILDPDYFLLLTHTEKFKAILKQYITGMKVYRVHPRDIENIEITLPSIEIQRKIADLLITLDRKVKNNEIINNKLEETAKAIYNEWFVNFNFPDENGLPYKDNGGEFYETELGEIPVGWEVGFLKQIINISSGKSIKDKSNMKDNIYKYDLIGASKVMAYTRDFNLDDKVLIIGRVGTLGIIQRINRRVWASDNTLIITPKYFEYTYNLLKNIDYSVLNRGSTQPLITQTDIKNLTIIIPKNEILDMFEEAILPLSNKIENNEIENYNLDQLKKLLLNKLISGQIDVNELDIDWGKLSDTLEKVEEI